jgi:hypothetical protein
MEVPRMARTEAGNGLNIPSLNWPMAEFITAMDWPQSSQHGGK